MPPHRCAPEAKAQADTPYGSYCASAPSSSCPQSTRSHSRRDESPAPPSSLRPLRRPAAAAATALSAAAVQSPLLLLIIALSAVLVRGALAGQHRDGGGGAARGTYHYHDSRKNELRAWSENRYIKCLFCMDYDDYEHLSVFGCNAADLPTCYGNACYMRQHKDNKFFLYTSGCLNITQKNYMEIRERTTNVKPARGKSGNETQLCEVTMTINTCLCTNRHACNNISSVEPFSEFTQFIFKDTNFDEVAHFRHFLPHDPILKDPNAAILRRSGKNADQYVLLSRSAVPNISAGFLHFIRGRFARRKADLGASAAAIATLLLFLMPFILFRESFINGFY